MGIDLSRFKVIHGNKVLNAVSLIFMEMGVEAELKKRNTILEPKMIEVLAINENGNIVTIKDESWRFQFLPIIQNMNS